jgi:RNA polymerase primary sigma factor
MATKPTVSADTVTAEQDVETTLLDVQTAAVKRLIARGKERGYITFDELNLILPPEQNSSEQIEDVMANFNEMGIQVVEGEEAEDGEAPVAKVEKAEEAEEEEGRPATSTRRRLAAPTTRCGCICARWAASSCCRVRAKSPSPSGSRPAAT